MLRNCVINMSDEIDEVSLCVLRNYVMNRRLYLLYSFVLWLSIMNYYCTIRLYCQEWSVFTLLFKYFSIFKKNIFINTLILEYLITFGVFEYFLIILIQLFKWAHLNTFNFVLNFKSTIINN